MRREGRMVKASEAHHLFMDCKMFSPPVSFSPSSHPVWLSFLFSSFKLNNRGNETFWKLFKEPGSVSTQHRRQRSRRS